MRRLILAALVVLFGSSTAFALSAETLHKVQFDAVHYSDTPTVTASCSTAVASDGTTEQNKAAIWKYLTGQGLSPEQAAGIMGNMAQESGFDPTSHPEPKVIGIIQWTDGRYDAIVKAAADDNAAGKNVNVTDLQFQLDYLYTESNARQSKTYPGTSEWDGLRKETSVQDAVTYWEANSERANPAKANMPHRQQAGQDVFNQFTGGTGGTAGSPGASCGSNATIAGVTQKVSFNTFPDPNPITPTALILHWWAGTGGIDSLISTLNTRNLSVQIATTVDGTVYQLTPQLNSHAEHASCANSWAIGNEIEGGVKFGPDPAGSGQTVALDLANDDAQFQSVVNVTGELMKQFNIPLDGPIANDASSGSGVHSHKEVDAKCATGSGKDDVDDVYLKRVKDELAKRGFK